MDVLAWNFEVSFRPSISSQEKTDLYLISEKYQIVIHENEQHAMLAQAR